MENSFIKRYIEEGGSERGYDPMHEDALFKAFEVTLELLKQIHLSKGEVIDNEPIFQKRVLKTA